MGIVEADGDGGVAPGIVEDVATVGDQLHINAQATGGLFKDTDLVAEFGGKQQETHECMVSFAEGGQRVIGVLLPTEAIEVEPVSVGADSDES